jgi:hypothetical protein
MPLTAANTLRIHRFNNEQIRTQVNQQRQQIEATRNQLEQATPEQLQSLVPTPTPRANCPMHLPAPKMPVPKFWKT